MEEDRIITDVNVLTPEYLTKIFVNNGYLTKGTIVKITCEKSLLSTGFHLHLVSLTFSEDVQEDKIVSSIIVKTPQQNMNKESSAKNEVDFYNLIAKSIKNETVPICFDAAFNNKTNQSHIILEDLSETHNEYSFSKWWPVPPLKKYCESAVACLSEFHASLWDHKKIEEIPNKSFLGWLINKNQELELMLDFLGDRISDARREKFETVFSKFPELAKERKENGNMTIIHDDAHFCNFMYPKNIDSKKYKTKLIDWEDWTVGIGTMDLAYMIGFYWSSERRKLMEKELIKKYHETLLHFGVKNYSWEDCWQDYRFSLFMNLYRVVSWWKGGAHISIVMMGLENSFPTLEDANSLELLEK